MPSDPDPWLFQKATGSLLVAQREHGKVAVASHHLGDLFELAAARRRGDALAHVRATAAGSRLRSVMISGAPGTCCGAAADGRSDGLIASVFTRFCANAAPLAHSAKTRKTVGRRESVSSGPISDAKCSRAWLCRPDMDGTDTAGVDLQSATRTKRAGLLLRHLQGEFAVADPDRQAFREGGGSFLAIGGNEFREGGKQAGLRQAIAIDTVRVSPPPRPRVDSQAPRAFVRDRGRA